MALPKSSIMLGDPVTPHVRIAIKESKVIRLVQWPGQKKDEKSANNIRARDNTFNLTCVSQVKSSERAIDDIPEIG
jgi:hypothetical protein